MIKLSKKGNYAIKTTIFLAKSKQSFFKISEISEKLEISESLLRRIIADLEKENIIKTKKGRNGGVMMGRDLKDISIFDILFSVGEEVVLSDCAKGIKCQKIHDCDTFSVYNLLQKSFNSVLKLYSLDKLVSIKLSNKS